MTLGEMFDFGYFSAFNGRQVYKNRAVVRSDFISILFLKITVVIIPSIFSFI